MSNDSLKNEINKKRSSSEEDLFFHYPLHSIWRKTRKQIFESPTGQLAYEALGNTYVVAGDPAGKSMKDKVACFENFLRVARRNKKSVCGYYFSEHFSQCVPMNRHQAGVSLLQNLRQWSLRGKQSEEARRALRKGRNRHLKVVELTSINLLQWNQKLMQFSQLWRRSKGLLQIQFLLSPLSESFRQLRHGERLFMCLENNNIQAVISLRNYGEGNWYTDQLMQRPDGHRFALDFLLVNVMIQLKSEGAAEISFGFCPGIIDDVNTWVEKVLSIWGKTRLFYSPKGLYNFKRKYSGQQLNRYLLVDPYQSTAFQLLRMEQVTMSWKTLF